MAQPTVTISAQVDESRLAASIDRAFSQGVKKGAARFALNDGPIRQSFGRITNDVRSFDQALDRANRRLISLGTAGTVIYGTVRAFKELVTAGIAVEKSLTSINSIFGLSQRQLDSFSKDLFNVARQTGQSFNEVAKAAEEFARQGLDATETALRTRNAMILVRLSGVDATKAINGLTAAMSTFGKTGLDTTEIINKLVRVDQQFAVSSGGLIDAFTRVGSTLDDAGVSFERFIGLVTAARQITGKAEGEIGNSLKTILTRLGRSSTIDQLEKMGIAVRDSNGALKSTNDILNTIATSYGRLSTEQQRQIDQLSAGVYQVNQFKAIVKDLGQANGLVAQAGKLAAKDTNEALIRNAALNQTLDVSIQNLKTNATEFSKLATSLSLKPILTDLISLGNIATTLFSKTNLDGDNGPAAQFGAVMGENILKGIGNVLGGPGLVVLLRTAFGAITRTFPEVIKDLKSTSGYATFGQSGSVGDTTALRASNVLLAQATEGERKRYMAAASVAEQERIILSLYERQLQVGVVGTVPTALRRLRGGASRVPGAAGGFIPDAMSRESAAISAGIGGAPANARPVYLPNVAGGLVGNTSEFLFPTSRGMGVANRDMIRRNGLPPGSTPIAAGGYVPNAADGMFDYSLRTAKGQTIAGPVLDKLNALFVNIQKASTGDAARKLSVGINEISATLNAASRDLVSGHVGAIIHARDRGSMSNPWAVVRDATASGGYVPPVRSTGSGSTRNGQWANGIFQSLTGPSMAQQLAAQDLAMRKQEAALMVRERAAAQRRATVAGRAGALQMGLLGGSFFAGTDLGSGLVPDSTSGRMTLGAARSGVQGAATGAFAGSMFGPIGTAVGAAAGGVGGAVYGLISRSQKSFGELATSLEESNRRISAQIEGAAKVFQLDDQENELKANGGSPRDIARVRRQRTALIASIDDKEARDLILNRAKNPNALQDTNRRLGAVKSDSLSAGALVLAGGGSVGFTRNSLRQTETTAEAITPMLAGLSDVQLKAFRSLSQRDPDAALAYLARTNKLTPGQKEEMGNGKGVLEGISASMMASGGPGALFGALLSPLAKRKTNTTNANATAFLTKAIDGIELSGSRSEMNRPSQPTLSDSDFDAIRNVFDRDVALGHLSTEADLRIRQGNQRVRLDNPALTDIERTNLSGRYDVANIRAESRIRRDVAFSSGQSNLIGLLESEGIKDPAVAEAISGVSDLSQLKALIKGGLPNMLSKEAQPKVLKAMEALALSLETLDGTEKQNIRVTEELTKIREQQLKDSKTVSYVQSGLRRSLLDANDAQRTQDTAIMNLAQGPDSNLITGDMLTGAKMSRANQRGRSGDAAGSFSGGFGAVFAGAKQEIMNFGAVGEQVANSLGNSFSNAFGDFVTGAKSAKDAFRDFVLGVMSDAARAFATKAVVSLLGMAFGHIGTSSSVSMGTPVLAGGSANGGPIGFARGGQVPVGLTSGEVMISPAALRGIGLPRANAINAGRVRGLAAGGTVIRGGSGVADDLFGQAPAGSYVFKKSAVQRYGEGNLVAMANSAASGMDTATTTDVMPRFADGGSVSSLMAAPSVTVGGGGMGGVSSVNVGVTINDHSTQTTSETSGGGSQGNRQMGELLAQRMKAVALQTIAEQQRQSGLLFRSRGSS